MPNWEALLRLTLAIHWRPAHDPTGAFTPMAACPAVSHPPQVGAP